MWIKHIDNGRLNLAIFQAVFPFRRAALLLFFSKSFSISVKL